MIKSVDLWEQYLSIQNDVDTAIRQVIENSAFVGGKRVADFENAFASYHNADTCVGVGNGTDALEIAIEGLQLPKKSKIIVPANSFVASSEAVTRAGHTVVFCDCDCDTYTISLPELSKSVSPMTSAVIAVHLYGHTCDMDGIKAIAAVHDLKVIEDCAQAHGAEYKGCRVGTIGDVSAFSFYPGKNLGAYGDGGAVLTNNKELAERCRMIANHGRLGKYDHAIEGRNSRLDGLQAAILGAKLPHLDAWNARRRDCAERYRSKLAGVGDLALPIEAEWAHHVYHLFVVQTTKRDELRAFLNGRNVQTGIHYPTALPRLEAYEYLGQQDKTPSASAISHRLLSLPMGPHLSDADVDQVCVLIAEFFESAK